MPTLALTNSAPTKNIRLDFLHTLIPKSHYEIISET